MIVALAVALVGTPALARQPSGAELLRGIDKLGVVGNVLYVAAHPDDENTRLLAWLGNAARVRTGYLSLTRGEGGQNLIGPEQAPLLGIIRTDELLAARSVDGAEQHFTRARDFGYSKTPAETLEVWDHDAILDDVVAVMTRFHPDVVITRFPPSGAETHGHHTASAMLAVEAFGKLPPPLQPKRIVWNRFSFGGPPPSQEEQRSLTRLDVGGYDAVLGQSFGELAAQSRSMHKSQGFGVAPSRGEAIEWFRVLAGEPAKKTIFDGIDLTWARVPGGRAVGEHIARIRGAFLVDAPSRSVPELVALEREMAALPDHPWKAEKLAEVDALIAGCLGLWADATVADHVAVPGGEVAITVSAVNRSPAPLRLKELRLPGGTRTAVEQPLEPGKPYEFKQAVTLPAETPLTHPYWLELPPERGHWMVKDAALVGLPKSAPLAAELLFTVAGTTLTLLRPLVYKWVDPVAGERSRALEVLPPVSVDPRASLLVFADVTAAKTLAVRIHANRAGAAGALAPTVPQGWRVEPASIPFTLANKGDERELAFKVHAPDGESSATLRFVATVGGAPISRGVVRIEHPHIPIETLTPAADVKLVRADIKHKRTRIGYIPGAGDEVPEALRQVGYDVTSLNEEQLAHGSLAPYQAIVTGVRAFNVDKRLPYLHDQLMKYVAGGGTLVVQYNTVGGFNPSLTAEMGPAPFKITHTRVTEENAQVRLLEPHHSIVSRPNKLAPRDFDGWVQERGLYFAEDFAPAYAPIFGMHDAGEPERTGGLIVARHGKGAFIYTGLAFFRQLPAGVAGAYRLFANLIDYAP